MVSSGLWNWTISQGLPRGPVTTFVNLSQGPPVRPTNLQVETIENGQTVLRWNLEYRSHSNWRRRCKIPSVIESGDLSRESREGSPGAPFPREVNPSGLPGCTHRDKIEG
jgi:hypothetical protein